MKRGGEAFHLLRAAAADDGCGNGGMMQRPGYRDNAGLDIVWLPDFAENFDQAEIAGQTRLVELDCTSAPVVLRKAATRSAVIFPVSRPETIGE